VVGYEDLEKPIEFSINYLEAMENSFPLVGEYSILCFHSVTGEEEG
jgi:hypothetical protein